MPGRRTFRARREVATGSSARKTKAHRYERDFVWIIEQIGLKTRPFPKTVPTGVGPWNATFMDTHARCLADDHNRGRGAELDDRAGASWKMFRTQRAGSNFCLEDRDGCCGHGRFYRRACRVAGGATMMVPVMFGWNWHL